MSTIYFGIDAHRNDSGISILDNYLQNNPFKNNKNNKKSNNENFVSPIITDDSNSKHKSKIPKPTLDDATKKLISIQKYNYNLNVADKSDYKFDYMINNDGIILSPYLEKNMEIYIWDWDNTLIDINAYYRHSMNPSYITNPDRYTDKELNRDFPHHKYFKTLVLYLIKNGKGVGIASFGTYSIIKAYMDRVFGANHNPFHGQNMYASCQDVGCVRDYTNMPTNKNSYIQKIMNFYNRNDYQRVVLFDDRPTNIADAARLGVVSVQIGELDLKTGKLHIDKDELFGPKVMYKVEQKILESCSDASLKPYTRFGALGDRKRMMELKRDGYYYGEQLSPNFKTEHFENYNNRQNGHDNDNINNGNGNNGNNLSELKKRINRSKKERIVEKKLQPICDSTGCYGFFNKSVGQPPYIPNSVSYKPKSNSVAYNSNSNSLSNNSQSVSYNGSKKNKINGNNQCPNVVKEGFGASCVSCQGSGSSVIVLVAFLILFFMIAGLCYFG